jgi:RNA polymerase sigma-70 factor (ECF subfamily)
MPAARAEEGNAKAAYGRIVTAVQPVLLQRALCLTRDPDEASDLVQATLERGYRSFERFRAGTNAASWLSTIMTNHFIDERRRERPMRRAWPLDQMEIAAPTPDEIPVWVDVQYEEVKEAAAQLPDGSRVPFELRSFDRLSYREIADRLGLPMNTVCSRIHRARSTIKRVLLARLCN